MARQKAISRRSRHRIPTRSTVDGLLIIDKPGRLTSHDVVDRVRRVLGTRRVGHTGTLDPFATGVMVVIVGMATRLAQFLDKDQKEYEATVRLGFETDTGDRTGEPTTEVKPGPLDPLSVEKVLSQFLGDVEQVPPMYSAKKIDGKKLYEHARQGHVIERRPQVVTISELELLDASQLNSDEPMIRIRVACSAGTYIRVLAEDVGRRLQVGAHLAELRRTRSGRFRIAQSISLDDLAALPDPKTALRPIDEAVSHLAAFALPADRVERTLNGLPTRVFDQAFSANEAVRMMSPAGEMIAIGSYDPGENVVRPRIVLG